MSATDVTIQTLTQLSAQQDWRLSLAHDRPQHLLIWITRGQGRLLLDGQRRGVGAHNAIFVPAGHLFALELGRQGMGQAVAIRADSPQQLLPRPRHLRVRDVQSQSELTALIDAAQREAQATRPLAEDAVSGYVTLMSVWLRRQAAQEDAATERRTAAERLCARYCARISGGYSTGASMAAHAAALSVTPTHLTRACKAATGRTAADLLTERVLYAARDRLARTKAPAQDIARDLGFGSAAYFTRFIRQHTGQPPSALRPS